jgi:MFS family permease
MQKDASLPPAFVRLSWSNLSAQFSEQVALAAAPLVAVLLLGADAGMTGMLQTAQTLPFLVLSIPAGVLADRASRKRLMVIAEALRALALALILLALLLGLLSLPVLAMLGFLVATGTVAYSVAAPALIQGIVPRESLGAANRWLELSRSTAFAAGPALGGAVVGWTGASTAYVLATLLSLLAVILLSGLPEAAKSASIRKHPLRELKEGASLVWSHPLLRPILISSMVFNTSWFILQAIYVLYAVHNLGMTAAEIGLTLGTFGAGMMAGALAARQIGNRFAFGNMIAIGPLCGLVAALVMTLTIWFPSAVLAYFSFFLFGMGPILWTIATTTLRQAVTPNAMMGRVSALIMTASFGARPVGAAIGALVGERYGTQACLVIVLLGFVIQFIVIMVSPVPRLKVLPVLTA